MKKSDNQLIAEAQTHLECELGKRLKECTEALRKTEVSLAELWERHSYCDVGVVEGAAIEHRLHLCRNIK